MSTTSTYQKYEQLILGTLGIVLAIGVWQGVSDLGLINPLFLSSPFSIFNEAIRQFSEGLLWADFGTTLLEIAIAFLLASLVGVLTGLMMGMFSRVEFSLEPFVWFLYSMPLIAFYPLFVVYLGLGFNTVVMMGFIMAVIPITINTLTGVKSTNPILVRAARSFNATNRQIVFKIALPSALPFIVTGLKLGVERTLIGVIVGEMFSSNSGLGFRISSYGARLQTTSLFVPLAIVIVLGLLATQLLRLWEHHYLDRSR